MAEGIGPSTSGSGATSVNYGSVEVASTSAGPVRSTTQHYVDFGTVLAKNEETTPKEEQPKAKESPYPYAALTFIFLSTAIQR